MNNFIKFQLGSVVVKQQKTIAETSRCGGVKRWQHSLGFHFDRCLDFSRNQRSLTLRHNKVNEHLKQELRSQFQGFASQDFASCDWFSFKIDIYPISANKNTLVFYCKKKKRNWSVFCILVLFSSFEFGVFSGLFPLKSFQSTIRYGQETALRSSPVDQSWVESLWHFRKHYELYEVSWGSNHG